jgi:hypothetical protein
MQAGILTRRFARRLANAQSGKAEASTGKNKAPGLNPGPKGSEMLTAKF